MIGPPKTFCGVRRPIHTRAFAAVRLCHPARRTTDLIRTLTTLTTTTQKVLRQFLPRPEIPPYPVRPDQDGACRRRAETPGSPSVSPPPERRRGRAAASAARIPKRHATGRNGRSDAPSSSRRYARDLPRSPVAARRPAASASHRSMRPPASSSARVRARAADQQ